MGIQTRYTLRTSVRRHGDAVPALAEALGEKDVARAWVERGLGARVGGAQCPPPLDAILHLARATCHSRGASTWWVPCLQTRQTKARGQDTSTRSVAHDEIFLLGPIEDRGSFANPLAGR